MKRKNARAIRGSILMLSYLVAASTLLLLVQVFAGRTLTETNSTARFINFNLAQQTADSGVKDALARLIADPTYQGSDPDWNGTDATDWTTIGTGQRFRTQITGIANPYQVTSQATVGNTTRTLSAFVEVTNAAPFQHALFATTDADSALEVNWNAQTNSYISSTDVNPVTFGNNGHVGTNGIVDRVIYVHNGGQVNGNAESGPGGTTSDTIKTAAGGVISGTQSSLPSILNYPLLSAAQTNYPFVPTTSASPNAAGTDPNDWKNPLIALPATWLTEISSKQPANSGGVSIPSTISSSVAYSGCSYFVSGLLTVDPGATLDFTGGGACLSGVKLRATSVMARGTIRGVTQLLVNGAGGYVTVNSGSIQFSGPDPILWVPGDVDVLGIITSWGSITGVKYLYAETHVSLDSHSTVSFAGADSLLYTPGKVLLKYSGDQSIDGVERVYAGWPVTSYSSVNDATVAVWGTNSHINFTSSPAAALYSAGDIIIGREGNMSNLRYLYGGRHYLSDSSACVFTMTCSSHGPSLLTFDPAGTDNLFYIEDRLGILHANSGIHNVNRLYGGSRSTTVSALDIREQTSFAAPIQVTFTGSHPTLYAYGHMQIGPRATITGLEYLYAHDDVYDVGCSCYRPSINIVSWGSSFPERMTFSGSNASIFTQGSIRVSKDSLVTHSSNRPTDLLIASTGTVIGISRSITLTDTGARVNAAIYAPQIPVVIKNEAQMYGAAIGRTATLTDANSRAHYDETLATQPFPFAQSSAKLLAVREQ